MNLSRTLLVLLSLWASGAARAGLEITVTGGEVAALPIAVVPFAGSADLGLDIAAVVSADLSRSGQFRTVDPAGMLERPAAPDQVDFRNWRAIAVDNLVLGQVVRSGGGMAVRVQLMDVLRGRQLDQFEVPVADPRRLRPVAHRIADLVYEQLTGIPGYFNSQIAYVAVTGPAGNRLHQIVIADSDGYNPVTVASSREPLMSPAWSPDRRSLAYVGFERGRSAIYIHDLASGALRKLVAERGINGAPAWSPDGRSLAVTLSFEINSDIFILDVASGLRRQLTHNFAIDTEPDWSPDGREIVFTSDRGGQPQVYIVSAAGGEARRLTFEGRQNSRARFSPDGKWLALVNQSENGYRIGLLDYKTRELRILSEGPNDESPSFSPNGAVVVYAVQSRNELATVSVDGRIRQRLSQPGDVHEPAWSPVVR